MWIELIILYVLTVLLLTITDESLSGDLNLRIFGFPVTIYHHSMRRRLRNLHKKFFRLFEKKKSFEKFLDLPPNIRKMIIDQMRGKDRFLFTKCSKQSRREAMGSDIYIKSLSCTGYVENRVSISIGHNKNNFFTSLIFEKKNWQQWLKCVAERNEEDEDYELWREKLDNSVDLAEHAAEHFKKLLKNNQNKIKHLAFYGDIFSTKLRDYDFGIERLSNLKILCLVAGQNIPLYLSKIQEPLETFVLNGIVEDNRFLNECDQIYQVQNIVSMLYAKLTNEQFKQLSTRSASLHIGYLTEENIYDFVQSWKNGTIGKEVTGYNWRGLEESGFDLYRLFELFGEEFNFLEKENVIEIRHDIDDRKSAKLSYCNYEHFKSLMFQVIKK